MSGGVGASLLDMRSAPSGRNPPRHARTDRAARAARLGLWVFVGVGVLLRLRQWVAGRSLWLDEISIALNLQTRSYGELTGTLGRDQVAPVGWLWIERWMFVNVGSGERALKVVPLLFGCAALVAIALLARRLLSPVAATVATALAAFSPPLIRYSNELKQYSSDTFWVPALVWLTLRCMSSPLSWAAHLVWAGLATLGFAFSHALLLVVAGCGLVLAGTALHRRDRAQLARVATAGAVVAVAVAVTYLVQLSRVSGSGSLDAFWTKVGGFPAGQSPSEIAAWLAHRALTWPADPAALAPAALGLAVLVIGAVALARRDAVGLLVLTSPVAVAVLAATVHVYPLAGRVSVYLVPLVLVLAAAALDVRQSIRSRAVRTGAVVAIAALLLPLAVPQVVQAARQVVRPFEVSETREALEYVAEHRRPSDLVFVYYTAGSSTLYYAPKLGVRYDGTLYLTAPTSQQCKERPAPARLAAAPRAWAVFGVPLSSAPADERDIVLAHLATSGRLVDSYLDTEAGAFLYDLQGSADYSARDNELRQRAGLQCLVIQPPPPFPPEV